MARLVVGARPTGISGIVDITRPASTNNLVFHLDDAVAAFGETTFREYTTADNTFYLGVMSTSNPGTGTAGQWYLDRNGPALREWASGSWDELTLAITIEGLLGANSVWLGLQGRGDALEEDDMIVASTVDGRAYDADAIYHYLSDYSSSTIRRTIDLRNPGNPATQVQLPGTDVTP